MIAFRTGDLLQADADALVNAVNCVGVMGRGIALHFKKSRIEAALRPVEDVDVIVYEPQ